MARAQGERAQGDEGAHRSLLDLLRNASSKPFPWWILLLLVLLFIAGLLGASAY